MPRPNDVGVGTMIVIFNSDFKVLLGKRKGSHREGCWSSPGGWLDRGELDTTIAVTREVAEETGLVIHPDDVSQLSWTVEDHPDFSCVTLNHWTQLKNKQTPQLLEPNKCDGWDWFSPDELPSPLFPNLDKVIAAAWSKVQIHQHRLAMSVRGL